MLSQIWIRNKRHASMIKLYGDVIREECEVKADVNKIKSSLR